MWVQEQVGRLVAELAETWPDQTEPAVKNAAVVASAATEALVAPGPRLGEVWVYLRAGAGAPLDCFLQVKTVLSDEKLHENSPESETSLH